MTDAAEILEQAKRVLTRADRRLGSTRFTAAALLARQALESALDEYWGGVAPGLVDCNGRAQLIALPFYLSAPIAEDATYAWNRLSVATHHDAYELPPTATELAHLVSIVEKVILTLETQ